MIINIIMIMMIIIIIIIIYLDTLCIGEIWLFCRAIWLLHFLLFINVLKEFSGSLHFLICTVLDKGGKPKVLEDMV